MSDFEETLKNEYIFNINSGCWVRPNAESFKYTDGNEVENNIIEIIKQAKDVKSNSLELSEKCTDWPTTYHLSPMRSNLLRPIKESLKGRILEVGAGLGAITRFLGEQGGNVLALEGSLQRSTAIKARCRNLENVVVLAESFHQFNAVKDFDVIILVGVLEYARQFFVSDNQDPVDMMLSHARSLLKQGGLLVIAIENQLGLKYFAGYPEDHIGIPMYGIEDLYSDNSVVTFGQKELRERLSLSGFPAQNWWFPFPDYKLPVTVLSSRISETKVDLTSLLIHSVNSNQQKLKNENFSLQQAWKVIFRNGLVNSLSNSFLILASDNNDRLKAYENNVIGHYFSTNRRPEFAKEIVFEDAGNEQIEIKKTALFPNQISNENNPISIELKNESFIVGENWQHHLYTILNKPDWSVTDITTWASVWYDALLHYANIDLAKTKLDSKYPLSGDLFDAIPRNLIMTQQGYPHFFDQEWHLKFNIDLGYLIFRGVYLELISTTTVAQPIKSTSLNSFKLFRLVAKSLGIIITKKDIFRYAESEKNILNWAVGSKTWLTHRELLNYKLTVRSTISKDTFSTKLKSFSRNILKRMINRLEKIHTFRESS